jgi:UDP-glucose 4-epimerase
MTERRELPTGDPAHLAGAGAELVRGDVQDTGTLLRTMAGPGAVIHLAAAGSVVGSVVGSVAEPAVTEAGGD